MMKRVLLMIMLAAAGAFAAGSPPEAGSSGGSASAIFYHLPTLLCTAGDTLPAPLPIRRPRGDLWLAKDKADHLVVSAFLVGLGYYAARKEFHLSEPGSTNLGAGFSLSLGLLKEVRDQGRRGGFFSLKDLAADLAGIGLGYLLCSAGAL
ncbi:MAG: lipoprotein [bacterium ADurb.Bin431]|nr:MAG: lipoprotein [bacterium ADurb.Bin431]